MNIVPLMVIVAALFAGTPQQLQTFDKRLTYLPIKGQPVEITSFFAEGRKLIPNLSFKSIGEDIDWLKNFSFDVKNTSSQPIQFINLNLVFQFNDPKLLPCVQSIVKGETMGPNNKAFGKRYRSFPETQSNSKSPIRFTLVWLSF
jgi:hypothetical protein